MNNDEQHKLISVRRLSDFAAASCFTGFVWFMIAKVPFNVEILFRLFFPLKLISKVFYLILYLKPPKHGCEAV